MSTELPKIIAFSAELQRDTEHTVDIDGNGEVIVTCTETGRFLKFPAGTTGAELKDLLAKHKADNSGQITQASIDERKAELIKDLAPEDLAPQG